MKIMLNRWKVRVHKTPLWMNVTVLKRTLLKIVFIGKEKTKWDDVKPSTHVRCRWQNILTKVPGDIFQERKATTPFEAWNYFITDEISDNIVQRMNQYIFIHLTIAV